MLTLRSIKKSLHSADYFPLLYLLLLTVIILVKSGEIKYALPIAAANVFVIFAITYTIVKYESAQLAGGQSLLKIIRYWYGIAAILISFKETYHIVYCLKPEDWDLLFIKLDYSIFGVNPTQWMYRFRNPWLTEFLQLVYMYYYPMIVVFGIEIYRRNKYEEYKYVILAVFSCFFTSYLLYLFFPADGPRFHLHNFYAISNELPGVFFTDWIRDFLNMAESIPKGIPNPQDYVQRDAMPSLHASEAMVITYLSWKLKSKSFRFYLPYLAAMLLATVYLRYHYVVDLAGGAITAAAAIVFSNFIYNRIKSPST